MELKKMQKQPDKLCLVVPCYNEESILENSASQLLAKLASLRESHLAGAGSFILFVDDGSKDRTWEIIAKLHADHPAEVSGLKLAANRGHQNALLSGLLAAGKEADAIISLDADLQDDIDVLDQFMREYLAGCDIVYGVRSDRSSDSFFKRFSAESFYRLLSVMGVKTVFNHADFRLMSRRAIEALSAYGEVNLYLRGLVPLLGYRQSIVLYKRKKADRPTHYPLTKMLLLAWDGITSFSTRPIRLISAMGAVALLVCALMMVRIFYVKFFGHTVDGWTSLMAVVLFLGGIQLLAIGVIGEYIAKTYLEVKHRPRFQIEQRLRSEGDEN